MVRFKRWQRIGPSVLGRVVWMGQGLGLLLYLVMTAVFFFLLYSVVQRAVLSALRAHDEERRAAEAQQDLET